MLTFIIEMTDEAFFEEVLRRGLGDNTITNVRIKRKNPAVGKGANFLSFLWRFTLEYSIHDGMDNESGKLIEKEISLIVKLEPDENGPGLQLIQEQDLFRTELKVFGIVLPEIERLIGQRLSPKFFYGKQHPNIIVMEDLAPLGFKIKDRQLGLPMAHVLKVLETIAKFHAGSVYQYEKNPDVIKSFTDGIMTERTPQNMFRVLENTLETVIENIRRWPDKKFSRIADKLVELNRKFAEELVKVTDYVNDEFCVLNHGDCWINNIMFRENENGEPLEVVLVDYQMSVYSSPAIDLIYFLSICPEVNLKGDKDDFFLEEYLRVLTKTMTRLGCKTKPPTFEDLRRAMLKRRMWIVMSVITFYPRMIADVNEVESFDEILVTGETKMNIFKNPTATVALKKLLPSMDERGYLD